MGTTSTTRLYASSVAIVSGLYAISSSAVAMMPAPMMIEVSAALGIGGWIMLGVGIVVLVHGIILLTPMAGLLGRTSGPLMVLWATIMLVDQALLAALPGWGMSGSRMRDEMSSSMTSGMGWDAGMVALAVLMLASGLIMSSHGSSDGEMQRSTLERPVTHRRVETQAWRRLARAGVQFAPSAAGPGRG